MNFTPEMLNIAKNAKNAEELLALAKENNVELSEGSAKAYYETMNKTGELADDELDNVAGGTCYNGGRPVITIGEYHDCYQCKYCEGKTDGDLTPLSYHKCHKNGDKDVLNNCDNCKWCIYEKGLWLCDNPANRK